MLVVEPDDDIRHAIATALALEGCAVFEASTVAAASRIAPVVSPTVTVIEPLVSGKELAGTRSLRLLCERDPRPSVVVCTGLPPTDARRHEVAGAVGPVLFLTKPFRHEDLLAAVTAAHRGYLAAASPGKGGAGTADPGRAATG